MKKVLLKPEFKWEGSKDAKNYELIVSANKDFSSPIIHEKNIISTSYVSINNLEIGTNYYWKVISQNNTGSIIAANTGISFRTIIPKPEPSPGITKYYVSPSGEDSPGNGSLSKPFKTLAYTADMVPENENDTIFLNPGTYNETDPSLIPLGVNVIGAGEGNTVLSSDGVTLAEGISSADKDYKLWYDGSLIQLISDQKTVFRNNTSTTIPPADGNQILSGFTINGNNKKLKAGIWVENRNNVTMHHVSFANLAQRGAVFAPGNKNWYVEPDYYMTGTKIYNCSFLNSGKDLSDETLGNLCLAQLNGAEIYNIKIDDNEGYGIKFIYDGYFKNIKIHDCNINVSETDSKWGEDISIELWNVGPGNKIYNLNCNTWLSIVNHPEIFGNPNGTENMKVFNVKMIDKDGNSGKEAIEVAAPGVEIFNSYFQDKGFGMAVWDMGRSNIIIHHNIFYNTVEKNNWAGGPAVYIDNSRNWDFTQIKIYNNIFDNQRIGVRIKGNRISDIDIKNNIFLNNSAGDIEATGSNIVANNNLKFNSLNSGFIFTGVTSLSNNIYGSPGLLQTGNRWDDYYKPESSASLVINNGVDVGFPFVGPSPNIGAF